MKLKYSNGIQGKKRKKDFWDKSWNVVKGCNGPDGKHCPYCYACRFVKRLGFAEKIAEKEMKFKYGEDWETDPILTTECGNLIEDIKAFKPTFFEYVYAQKLRKKPTMYFFSMSDPAYWEHEWYERIVSKIAENTQHTFVILTKQPEIYEKYSFPHNTICGVTIAKQKDFAKNILILDSLKRWYLKKNLRLFSIEPIQERINLDGIMMLKPDWIHVGQESGNRKDRVIATRKMIEPFFNLDTRVFMKDNLTGIVPGRELRKELP